MARAASDRPPSVMIVKQLHATEWDFYRPPLCSICRWKGGTRRTGEKCSTTIIRLRSATERCSQLLQDRAGLNVKRTAVACPCAWCRGGGENKVLDHLRSDEMKTFDLCRRSIDWRPTRRSRLVASHNACIRHPAMHPTCKLISVSRSSQVRHKQTKPPDTSAAHL